MSNEMKTIRFGKNGKVYNIPSGGASLTSEEAIELLIECGIVDLAADNNNRIFTTNDGLKIYTL